MSRFVLACTLEMHMDISQEPFQAEIYKEMPHALDITSNEHWASTLTVRTPNGRTFVKMGNYRLPRCTWASPVGPHALPKGLS